MLITFDQWRADCLSIVGHPCLRTPHIDALAADGVIFRNHYTVASPCGPARASLLTALYLHNHGAIRNGVPLDRKHSNIALEMKKVGYQPTLFGFTDTTLDPRDLSEDDPRLGSSACMAPGFQEGLHLPGDAWPWIEWLESRGYSRPQAARDMWLPSDHPRRRITNSPTIYQAAESETSFLTDAVTDFIAKPPQTPWFVHLSYFRPHHPYISPEPYNRVYDPAEVPQPSRRESREREGQQHPWLAAQLQRQLLGPAPVQDKLPMALLDEHDLAQLRATYFGSVVECDDAIGRITRTLREQGQYERTLIILTADHGDMLGDHWLWAAEGYFDAAFKVPLIISGGCLGPCDSLQVNAFTESVDVMPTILESVGAAIPAAVDGRSLLPLLKGRIPEDWRTEVHWEFDFGDMAGAGLQADLGLGEQDAHLAVVRDSTCKYVHFAGLPDLYFDLADDPLEFTDRSHNSSYAVARDDARSRLLSWLKG